LVQGHRFDPERDQAANVPRVDETASRAAIGESLDCALTPGESTVSTVVDYYLAPQSPWTYLGHERFAAIARTAAARIDVRPVDLGGKVFPVSGGLPLARRAPQRQAYRLVELKRFSEHLGVPLNLQPKYFPVASDDAARLIVAVDLSEGSDAAMALTGALLRAVWVEERNIADPRELASIAGGAEVAGETPGRRALASGAGALRGRYAACGRRGRVRRPQLRGRRRARSGARTGSTFCSGG